jgi:hypothetical protein
MDLALHMGSTAGALSRNMTEAEFGDWQTYATRRMLPMRRIEMYLAQIAMLIAKTMGGGKSDDIRDFMFDPVDTEDDDDADLIEEARAFFDFNPINKA